MKVRLYGELTVDDQLCTLWVEVTNPSGFSEEELVLAAAEYSGDIDHPSTQIHALCTRLENAISGLYIQEWFIVPPEEEKENTT